MGDNGRTPYQTGFERNRYEVAFYSPIFGEYILGKGIMLCYVMMDLFRLLW